VNVGQTSCVAGVNRTVSELKDVTVPVPGIVNLAPATVYKVGQPIFVRVTDLDQNVDPLVREKITIELTVPDSGDREFLQLQETEPDSGQFVGYIQSGESQQQNGNCMLGVVKNKPIRTRYSDIFDETDNADSQALVDPFGKIFSTKDGRLIDGVTVTLINTATGQPADVFGDGPVFAPYPNPIVSGGEATDDAGVVYDFPQGEYRFPFVEPGFYKIEFSDIPNGLIFPSTASNESIQSLPGAPFQVVDGSFGEEFEVPIGPALNIDLPVDEPLGDIFVSKKVSRQVAAIGDFVQYRLTVENKAGSDVVGATVQDTLPQGFRYQNDSLRINGLKAGDPQVQVDGRTLLIDLPVVSGSELTVTYVTEITPGAVTGNARNEAFVTGDFVVNTNVAFADIVVTNELFSAKAFLVGRVVLEQCESEPLEQETPAEEAEELMGMPGVRIYLEDGSFVVTDEDGFWHMEGINPGAHVVQMDTDSLDTRYEASPCNDNTRFASSPYSQFVDIKGGTLWRADFKIQEKAPPESNIELTQSLKVDNEGIWVDIDVQNQGPVQLDSASIIYNAPSGWQVEAGSEMLDGAVTAHKKSIVGAVYDVGVVTESKQLRFRIKPRNAKASESIVRQDNQIVTFNPRFGTRKAELSSSDKLELDNLIRQWRDQDWAQITIIGHSDSVPIALRNRDEYPDNEALSAARAAAVAEYIGTRVKTNQLVVVGAGPQYPIASNETAEGRQQNRRVEFLLKPVEKIIKSNVVSAEVLNGESGTRLSFNSVGTARGATDSIRLPLNRLVGGFDKLSASSSAVAVGSWDYAIGNQNVEFVQRDPSAQGFINISDGDRLGTAVKAVKFDMDSRLRARLTLDGEEISSERIGFRSADEKTGKTLYSYIGVDFGEPGHHTLALEGLDPFGNARFSESIEVIRAGEVTNIRLRSAEGNIADGTTPVSVKLDLLDQAGEPVGIAYRVKLLNTNLRSFTGNMSLTELSQITGANYVDVLPDGTMKFEPVSVSGTYSFTLAYNDFEEEFDVFVAAEKRDWIMVGLAEGTTAYTKVSGNLEASRAAGIEDEVSSDGRIAFYAKGQVKGEFILTISYDTDKEKQDSLNQIIDPNSYYTLYGDRSTTQYDAASQEKLFLKLERDEFYALFGDFSTGINAGELTSYSRSFNGLKSEYRSEKFDVVVFASETDQGFVKDEIRGDGTSGIYRLTGTDIIVNSEKITIETRDRFQSQEIIDTKELRRFLDYNIDYDLGTIFFKEPIFSQDPAFNPVFIVVDYEVGGNGTDELNYGGRIAYEPIETIEVGVTLVKEGVEGRESELVGFDVSYEFDDDTDIRMEVAGSETIVNGVKTDGMAYIIEATRRTGNLDTQAYVREQQGNFGLGQQNISESATRKVGINAKYQIAESIEVAGEVYRESDLVTGTNQDVATSTIQMRGDQYSVSTGLRTAMAERDGEDVVSNQLLLGGSYRVLDGRLVLNANADTPIGGKGESGNFPKRLRVGLDYKLTENVTLKAEQEFTWGDEEDTQGTRIGMSTNLWEGGELVTSVEQTDEENSQRLAAVAGLKQRWELNENWSFDFGVDRSQTIKQTSKAPPPLTVTTVFSSPGNDDFTSVTFGSKFRKDAWDWATRVEFKNADTSDRVNLVSDVIRNLDEGQTLLAKLDVQSNESDDSDSLDAGIQLGYAYRPDTSRWTIFNRLDLNHANNQSLGFDTTTQKIVNNLNANYVLSDETQIAFQYGLKYVIDNFDDDEYRGFTDLYGMEVRHDLNNRWDVGFQGSMYNSWSADVSDYSYGVSVGYSMARNVWVSLGYNFDGFSDDDFSASEYTSEGVFLKYRMKFDQNTASSILGMMGNNN
jgi:uncharacterized repeat protein (TIGR01451 family)